MTLTRTTAALLGAAVASRAAWWADGPSLQQKQSLQILLDCARRAGSNSRFAFWDDEPNLEIDSMTAEEMRQEREQWQGETRDILRMVEGDIAFFPKKAVGL